MIPGVRERQTCRQILQQEIALLIVRAEAPGFRAALCLTYNLRLYLARLHLLFHLIIRYAHEELVSPPLIGEAHFQLS